MGNFLARYASRVVIYDRKDWPLVLEPTLLSSVSQPLPIVYHLF